MAQTTYELPPRRSLLSMRDRIQSSFDRSDWREVEVLTGCSYISSHPRLLRSLSWGDPDYSGCILEVLSWMYDNSPGAIFEVESYLDRKFPSTASGENISSEVRENIRKIVFNPLVFDVPDAKVDGSLISVMMPFSAEFNLIYETIAEATSKNGLTCRRASDIWEHSTVIQDIFSLIFRSAAVICDFTGKNPNVFYEAGIAHTLGKHVIPITQNGSDIPFDLSHHRYLPYHNNGEGLEALGKGVSERLWNLGIPF